METEETNTEEANKKDGLPAYPFKSHEQTFQFVKKIYDDLGHGDYHTREQIAALHNLAPNSTKQPISSAQQFGLLEIKHGTGYRTTELFARIYLPGTSEEQKQSVLESIRKASLYNELLSTYEKSGILPQQAGLINTLVRKGFPNDLAGKIIRDFTGALKAHGLLDDKNILRLSAPVSPTPLPPIFEQGTQHQPPPTFQQNAPVPPSDSNTVPVLIPLGNNRKATLTLPADFTEKEVRRISKFILAALSDPDEDSA